MEIKYNKKKRFDIKGWLLGGNSMIYMIILILFVTLAIVVFTSLGRITLNSGAQNESSFNVDTERTTYDDDVYIEESQSYMIRINKSTYVLTVYKLLRDDNYTPVYTFHCAINENVETGMTYIQGKQIWYRNDDWSYGHYTCILGNNAYIHSVPYWDQNKTSLNVNAYNKIGQSVSVGSIYLKASDAKWIYENCAINIPVEIYELAGEEPAISLEEFATLPGSAYSDPSDK